MSETPPAPTQPATPEPEPSATPERAEPTPSAAHPQPETQPSFLGLRLLLAIAALVAPPLVAAFAGFALVLMMAFAADAGIEHPQRADLALTLLYASLGGLAACGLPAAAAVALPNARKPLLIAAAALVLLAALGTVSALGLYATAL